MFLVNSHNPRFSATSNRSEREALHDRRHTFSRSYGVILPSSLTRVLSRALGFSPRPPESVCGTDTKGALYAAFLGSLGSPSVPDRNPDLITSRAQSHRLSLSGPSDSTYGLEHGSMHRVGLPFSVPACFKAVLGGAGILTCFPSPTPLGLGLGID